MDGLPPLSGQRLLLRAMADDDAQALFDIYSDPLVMQYTDEAPFAELATVGVMIASVRRLLARDESLEWAVVLRDSGALIGTCGLHSFDTARSTAEVGCLLNRSAWGQGYMQEALGLLMRYATEALALTSLSADIAPDNARAQRLFHALGFQQNAAAVWQRLI